MCLLSPLTINQILVALALLNKVPAVIKDEKISADHGAWLLGFEDLLTIIDQDSGLNLQIDVYSLYLERTRCLITEGSSHFLAIQYSTITKILPISNNHQF